MRRGQTKNGKIRVGLIVANQGNEWFGGAIYFSNLLHSIQSLSNARIQPVLISAPSTPKELLDIFPSVETVSTSFVDWNAPLGLLRKIVRRVFQRDYCMEVFLKYHGISAISHFGDLGERSKIPTIPWIPDFQHRKLPEFFKPEELAARDANFRFSCRYGKLIILSSSDAQRDLAEFDRGAVNKSRVMHFVSGFGAVKNANISLEVLQGRYGYNEQYFHLPNQFWAHKNHRLVVDALALLKARGRRILVLATGHTRDKRQPEHFENLMRHVAEVGVGDVFRVLGLVPYDDLAALMRHAVAIINPSLFEGWSTTVEEAKSMGKTILLSDIPVHREQDPEWATYFRPDSPEELANAMSETLDAYALKTDVMHQKVAQLQLPERASQFARNYENIVLEAIATR